MARPYCSALSTFILLVYMDIATEASRSIFSVPALPFFVVMTITPLAAREP